MTQTNSAKQLYNLLKPAWDNGQDSTFRVWDKLLKANDTNSKYYNLTLILALFNDVRNDIERIDINGQKKYLKALDKIQSVLMSSDLFMSESSWLSITDKAGVGEETLDLIDACGDLIISQTQGLNEISPEELEEIQKQIRNLQDEIRNSDIEKETKIFLINELRKIEDAILNYQIRGSNGLSKVSREVTGGIAFNWSQMPQKAQEKGKQIIDLALKVNGMISLSERLTKLPEGLKEVLAILPSANGR